MNAVELNVPVASGFSSVKLTNDVGSGVNRGHRVNAVRTKNSTTSCISAVVSVVR